MDPLLAARIQMEVSLGFHMVFAAAGIALPLQLVIAEGLWLRTGQEHYRELAHRWAKALAVLFAVGAVSGTALSFELGLLWPRFMGLAGHVLGPAFALEGYAFFLEAIFIGLYLYGWDRLSPRAHWLTGVPVALSGVASGVLVVAANSWMQHPSGVELVNGKLVLKEGTDVFSSPAWIHMSIHSTLACYAAIGFASAGVYAVGMLRGKKDAYHRSALAISLAVGAIASILQPISGDLSAQAVTRLQPLKLAAAEALFETRAGAPLLIGGFPDVERQEVRFGLEVPKALSLLAHHDPDAVVIGLDSAKPDDRPNVVITHLAFEVMVASGFALMALSAAWVVARWRKRDDSIWLLRAIALASPLGCVGLEAGWIVTEVGRQPWVITGILRTRDAVTPAPGVVVSLVAFALLYLVLGVATVVILVRLARRPFGEATREGEEHA